MSSMTRIHGESLASLIARYGQAFVEAITSILSAALQSGLFVSAYVALQFLNCPEQLPSKAH